MERERAIDEYFRVLKKAKRVKPDLLHHCKKTMSDCKILLHSDDSPRPYVIEEDDEIICYQKATKYLETLINKG